MIPRRLSSSVLPVTVARFTFSPIAIAGRFFWWAPVTRLLAIDTPSTPMTAIP
jgi:hypothetical protein